MVCTKGFRDVVEIGRGTRDDLWDAYKDNAEPYIRRRDRLEVTERVDHRGEVARPSSTRTRRRRSRGSSPGARSRPSRCASSTPTPTATTSSGWPRSCARRCPTRRSPPPPASCPSCSSTSASRTTVANAVLSPLVSGYVNDLDQRLKDDGYEGDLLILHSGGGVMTPEAVQELAVRLAASGHRRGRRGRALHRRAVRPQERDRRRHGRHEHRHQPRLRRPAAHHQRVVRRVRPPDLLPVDRGADDRRRRRLAGEDRRRRLAAQRPAVGRVATPARRRTARAARSPRTPTPTSSSAGSARSWSAAGWSSTATPPSRPSRRSASRWTSTLHEAADAIIAVANANMADAVRIISLQRGYDPREFALVVFGGAGPLHGAALAKELGVPTVLVPPRPGTWSALGCLMVDIRHDLSEMFLRPAADADGEGARRGVRAPGGPKGRELLADEGVERRRRHARALDRDALPRPVALARGRASTATSTQSVERFHAEHEREFSYRRDDAPVELYRLQLVATGKTKDVELPEHETGGDMPEPIETREVYFDGEARRHARLRAQRPPGGRDVRRPRRDRPARHHDARPTRREGRGRRVPEHPDGGELTWPPARLIPSPSRCSRTRS